MIGKLGRDRIHTCSMVPRFGRTASLLLGCFLVAHASDFLARSLGADLDQSAPHRESANIDPDLSSLNVRLSTKALHPPEELVKRTIPLRGLHGNRPLYGDPIRGAILEDDNRRQVVVLTIDEGETDSSPIRAHLMYEFDVESRLPRLTACAATRGCHQDRTPGAGGLACVAICLVEALRR